MGMKMGIGEIRVRFGIGFMRVERRVKRDGFVDLYWSKEGMFMHHEYGVLRRHLHLDTLCGILGTYGTTGYWHC